MIELMNTLLTVSRKLPNDAEYGYFCRRLINDAKETEGDYRDLRELASKIYFEIERKQY